MQLLSIDRIENEIAICESEDKSVSEIALDKLPKGVKEGTILSFDGKDYNICTQAEKERHERIAKKMDALFRD